MILALRLDTGRRAGRRALGPLAPHLDWALEAGLLEPFPDDGDGARVRLTTTGRLLSNELFARLV